MKQNPRLKHFLALIYIGFANITHAQDISPDVLINKSTVECSLILSQGKFLHTFYSALLDDKLQSKVIKNVPYKIQQSQYVLSGFHRISHTLDKTDGFTSQSTHLDLNIRKYDVRFLRVSAYSRESYADGGDFGYYFILQGSPNQNINLLKKSGIHTDQLEIEATKGGNTRLRCSLAG